jgi:hypothetical protein
VARRLLGEPNKQLSKKHELRYGKKGSLSIDLRKGTFFDHEANEGGGVLDLVRRYSNGEDPIAWLRREGFAKDDTALITFDYTDENNKLLFQVCRTSNKQFYQRRPNGSGGWINNLKGVRRVIYRLPQLLAGSGVVYIPEGEKHVDALINLKLQATTSPMGAGKWRAEYAKFLQRRDVVILPDNDDAGRAHAQTVALSLRGVAKRVRVLALPGLGAKGDVINWLEAGGTREELEKLAGETPDFDAPAAAKGVSLDDFRAYMPQHNYIYIPSREPWPATSVNARVPPVRIFDDNGHPLLDEKGEPVVIKASTWLDQNRPVEQMTWAPGCPMLIKDRLISEGGWIEREDVTSFNLYRPPMLEPGDASKADPWRDHIHKVFGDDAEHIIKWCAQRAQHPEIKINHALVLGSEKHGIGKDAALEPVKRAIGPWNFGEVNPPQLLGRFNGFLKRVILRVNEVRDLGDVSRYSFYDHTKLYTASPPDVLRIDEKNLREHSILNCVGIILTTNYKTTGIYLPAEDRRHYVAWSSRGPEDFAGGYWNKLFGWYDEGGDRHVAAYLAGYDLTGFDPKAPPPKTQAFWDIVDANRSPIDGELAAPPGSRTVNTEPLPGSLATVTSPPIMRASLRERARPSPVPP